MVHMTVEEDQDLMNPATWETIEVGEWEKYWTIRCGGALYGVRIKRVIDITDVENIRTKKIGFIAIYYRNDVNMYGGMPDPSVPEATDPPFDTPLAALEAAMMKIRKGHTHSIGLAEKKAEENLTADEKVKRHFTANPPSMRVMLDQYNISENDLYGDDNEGV